MNKVFSWAFAGALICGLNVFTSCSDRSDNPTPPSPEKEVSSEAVYKFFKEINGVPRPSMHEEKIRQYLIDFANARGLRFIDADGNIIIYKEATPGMKEAPTAILQTHMDMVCVAADGYGVDFLTTGIEQEDSDGFIHSKDYVTSLGADDGIGMAIVLAVLDSKEVEHGPLECLFTWDEEQGMSGARSLKPGILQGKYMLNIDNEEVGKLLVGAAGNVHVCVNKTFTPEAVPGNYASFMIQFSGLTGGHSGIMINNGGANANKLIADFLAAEPIDYRLVNFEGGVVPNAITTTASAVVMVPSADEDDFIAHFSSYAANAKDTYKDTDPDMSSDVHPVDGVTQCIPAEAADILVNGLASSPQGVLEWSVVEGMFELSNNIGVVSMDNPGEWYVKEMVRSFSDSKIDDLANQIAESFNGADVTFSDHVSPWSPDINSPLVNYASKVYQDIHGYPIKMFIVGGSVECSIFSETYPDVQIISYGPTILDAHTIRESVDISSVEDTWDYTLCLLRQFNELK